MTATNPKSQDQEGVVISLFDAVSALQSTFEKSLLPLNLSWSQFRLLDVLLQSHEPLKPTTLAGSMMQEVHSISGLLNRMEDRGLVTRTRDRRDRRVVWVSLTPDGRTLGQKAGQLFARLANELVTRIGDQDCRLVAKVSDRIRDFALNQSGMEKAKGRRTPKVLPSSLP